VSSVSPLDDPRAAGLAGARKRWGPPIRHRLSDLPVAERAAVADLLTRVRIERARQGLPPTVSDRAAVAAIASVLAKSEAPVIETPGASSTEGHGDDRPSS
jgi:hypothetical protein